MNLQNRRLKEIQLEKKIWTNQLQKCESISECFAFQGKLDLLEKEEREILKRCDVHV